MLDLSQWIDKNEAARRLGVKVRTIVEFVSQGKLKPRKYQRPNTGGGPISLFDPEQVQALLEARANSKMEVLPANTPGLVRNPPQNALAPALATVHAPPLVAIKDKRYLTLAEAASYTGLGKSYIAANASGVPHGPHGATVYKRTDLDKL